MKQSLAKNNIWEQVSLFTQTILFTSYYKIVIIKKLKAMLKVNATNYTNFKYSPYLERGQECVAPIDSVYKVGDVVYIKKEHAIGVILGCIDEKFDGAVRTDVCGMTDLSEIRHAVTEDFMMDNVNFVERLREECMVQRRRLNYRTLAAASNDSQVTRILWNTLNDKLSSTEVRNFEKWLQIVEQNKRLAVNKEKRKFRL